MNVKFVGKLVSGITNLHCLDDSFNFSFFFFFFSYSTYVEHVNWKDLMGATEPISSSRPRGSWIYILAGLSHSRN